MSFYYFANAVFGSWDWINYIQYVVTVFFSRKQVNFEQGLEIVDEYMISYRNPALSIVQQMVHTLFAQGSQKVFVMK